jgi:polar amino acid transport system substrate-binding protein
MKVRLSIAAAICAASLVAAVGVAFASGVPAAKLDKQAQALLPASIKSSKVIVTVTNAGYPPYEMYAANHTSIVGRDIDLAKALGQILGVTIKFQNVSFESIVPGLEAGRYQIADSGLTITPQRKKAVDFVAYSQGGDNIAVKPGNPMHMEVSKFQTLCGKTIGVTQGSSFALVDIPKLQGECKKAGKPAIQVSQYQNEDDRLALSSGRVDAILDDGLSLAYSAKQSKGQYVLGPGPDIESALIGIALVKHSDLTPAITAAVEDLVEHQTSIYKAINVKWGVPANQIIPAKEIPQG